MQARPATPDDAAMIADIYNQGLADRAGTFETTPRTAAMVRGISEQGELVALMEFVAETAEYQPKKVFFS